jgi:hypothetical protein
VSIKNNRFLLHFDIAVDDFASNPIIKVSMGTKMPPPPTPPTLPSAAPKNPIMVPTTIFQPNFMSCESIVTNHTHKSCQIDATVSGTTNRKRPRNKRTSTNVI